MWKNITTKLKKGDIISFVGGGGKTTLMFKIASELAKNGNKVLITTTTKIYDLEDHKYEKYVLRETIPLEKHGYSVGITVFGEMVKNSKIIGASSKALKEYIDSEDFDFVLIEADGSRRKSIKSFYDHEPVVPEYCNKVIAVVSLDSVGTIINESYTYNPNGLARILEKNLGDQIYACDVAKLLISDEGLFKNCSKKEKIAILTKCFNKERTRISENIIKTVGTEVDIYISY